MARVGSTRCDVFEWGSRTLLLILILLFSCGIVYQTFLQDMYSDSFTSRWPICDSAASAARGRWIDNATFLSFDECVPAPLPSGEELHDLLANRVIYALGDSQTMRVVNDLNGDVLQPALHHVHRLRKSNRCDTLQRYFDLQPLPPSLPRPQGPGVGPVKYGLDNRGCTDMNTVGYAHRHYGNNLEFVSLPCEFAKDVDLANELYPTTQETIFRYYATEHQPDLIFINNGVHDAVIANADEYEANVRWLFDLIEETTNAHVVFWSSPMPLGDPAQPQTSDLMNVFYGRVEALVAERSSRFHFLDAKHLGMGDVGRALHKDNIHLEQYSMLVRMWLMQMEEVYSV